MFQLYTLEWLFSKGKANAQNLYDFLAEIIKTRKG